MGKNMEERYSILKPFTEDELEFYAIEIINFFSTSNYRTNCKQIDIEPDNKVIRPLSYGDFFKYLIQVKGIDAYRYTNNLKMIFDKLVQKSILILVGGQPGGSPPFNQCYYSFLELTSVQRTNLFWLGRILGYRYLKRRCEPYIVRIEGLTSENISGTGSGILIKKNIILTCGHNLTDLNKLSCWIGDCEYEIEEVKPHTVHDIGIIKLKGNLPLYENCPYFGPASILDETLTLGYPPVKGMREAPLVAQSGEINACAKDWNGCQCITISSITRPGNSGGPVISINGYIVGIVTQQANSASCVSSNKDEIIEEKSTPFYNAICSEEIIKLIYELDDTIELVYENYQ